MDDNGKHQDEVVISINKLITLPTLSKKCYIYRVPKNLRQIKEDAYQPMFVSIGPLFYQKDPKLQPMQEHKLRYLQYFLQRDNIANNNIEYYVNFIRRKQQEIRNCYEEHINLNDNALVKMVFIDAAFIIELFVRYFNQPDVIIMSNDSDDRILGKPRVIRQVKRDLRIEENQLPFFILNDLYNLAFENDHDRPSFVSLTHYVLLSKPSQQQHDIPERIKTAEIKHFVDLLRICYLPCTLRTQQQQQHPSGNYQHMRTSATKLSEAGVRFKEKESKDLLHVTFTDEGILEIPRIRLKDGTESLFRNIMVFEQCHYRWDSYIVDYFKFMDCLIDTTKDVEILIENGIIENHLGSNKDVVNLFNNTSKQITMRKRFYYSDICKDLNAYANIPWHRWRAILSQKYFNHPWAAISVVYAIVILIVSVLQVIK